MNIMMLLSPSTVIGGAEKYMLTLYESSINNETSLNYSIACSHNYAFYNELKSLNYNVFWLGRTITDSTFSLNLLIINNCIDIVHTSGYHSSFIAMSHRIKFRNENYLPKIMSTEHGWINDSEQSIILSNLNAMLLPLLDYIVVVNKSMFSILINQGYTNVVFIKTPLQPKYITNRRNSKKKSLRKNILGIGRFEPVKNFKLFIQVAAELCLYDPHFKFSLVGSGSEEDEIRSLIKSLRLESNIFMHEFSSSVLKHYQNSDMLLMTSISEGTPLVLLESISMGLIPVAPALEGIKAASEHSNHLWYVDYTVSAVVDKIKSAYSMSVKCKDMMLENGFNYIESYHNPRTTLQKYNEIYQLLCRQL